jgi:hypothetical protein
MRLPEKKLGPTGTELYSVSVIQRRWFGYSPVVYQRAIKAAEVRDNKSAVLFSNFSVPSRNDSSSGIDGNVVLRISSEACRLAA